MLDEVIKGVHAASSSMLRACDTVQCLLTQRAAPSALGIRHLVVAPTSFQHTLTVLPVLLSNQAVLASSMLARHGSDSAIVMTMDASRGSAEDERFCFFLTGRHGFEHVRFLCDGAGHGDFEDTVSARVAGVQHQRGVELRDDFVAAHDFKGVHGFSRNPPELPFQRLLFGDGSGAHDNAAHLRLAVRRSENASVSSELKHGSVGYPEIERGDSARVASAVVQQDSVNFVGAGVALKGDDAG